MATAKGKSVARNRKEVRRQIYAILLTPDGNERSDRDIAKQVGCSPTTVGKARESLDLGVEIPRDPYGEVEVEIDGIHPSPENIIYNEIEESDPSIKELAESLKRNGQIDAIVLTLDRYIVSGHRRHCAAKVAGFSTIRARFERYRREDDLGHHATMVREANRQRDKSDAEKIREEIASANPEESWRRLMAHRSEKSQIEAETIKLNSYKPRDGFGSETKVFVNKIKEILESNKRFLPFSLRRLHYLLVSEETFQSKSASQQIRYENNLKSYKKLSDVTTRMRLLGLIPFEWINDTTRPEYYCPAFKGPSDFIRKELNDFGKGFYRDLMQSQPYHFHIHCEKNTIIPIVRDIASRYTIRVTSGRGFSSIPPRRRIQEQFRQSGKDRLVLLMLSDFDPEGECIVETFARSLRDDFSIGNITPVKVGLTAQQKDDFNLPPLMVAKRSSSRYDGFVKKHGKAVWEIEALSANALRDALTSTIDSMLDVEAFNQELDREKKNVAMLDDFRRQWMQAARDQGIDFGDE